MLRAVPARLVPQAAILTHDPSAMLVHSAADLEFGEQAAAAAVGAPKSVDGSSPRSGAHRRPGLSKGGSAAASVQSLPELVTADGHQKSALETAPPPLPTEAPPVMASGERGH